MFFRENNITIPEGYVANWELIVKQDMKVPETNTFNMSQMFIF